jgi:electron transport complex protein RnfB
MSDEIYQRLAKHLDQLPGGFPSTESGVEMRILHRLFTPEQAELAVHLTLLPEEAPVIARRAGLEVDQASQRLAEMAEKGLIYDMTPRNHPAQYMASQFVVGIWEYQVNKLSPELVQDVDEYFKELFDFEIWRETPQLRTIPIGESLPTPAHVMPYERAEELIQSHKRFVVAPCICRQERRLVGEGCDKPLETCLSMGGGADYYLRHGMGRQITKEEALEILKIADKAGLVLQPGNSQRASFICCCCGDCCGVLRNVKRHPRPASIVSSAYRAECDEQVCGACGDCVGRCQMEAIDLDQGFARINEDRCIGCGLCVTTCSTGAMHLVRKPEAEQPYVPRDIIENTLRLAKNRQVINNSDLVMMAVKSKVDRLVTLRKI